MNLLGRAINPNLRTKFLLPISAMLIVSMLLASGYMLDRQSDSFRSELETSGETMIKMLAINAESGVLFESEYMLDELLLVLARFEVVRYAVIVNLDGKVLSSTGKCNLECLQHIKSDHTVEPGGLCYKRYAEDSAGVEHLLLSTPVTTRRETVSREHLGMSDQVGTGLAIEQQDEVIGHIVIGLSLETVNEAIAEGRVAVILLSALVLIAGIFIVTLIVNIITKPVTALVAVTDTIRQGDLSRRLDIRQNDEIGHLARTFNSMIESLQQSREEIEEYNRTLEEKIVERTRQLEDAQAQLIQSEKLSAIGQLAAGVAHELNNPLGGILGYAQFTIEKLRKSTSKQGTSKEIASFLKYVSDIETQARRCKAIVQNLLKFSRSSRSVDFETVDLNAALEETVSFVEHQFRINQVELEVWLSPDLPNIQGNLGQLQQVFTNLLINALHASEPGQTVTMQSRISPAVGEFGGAVELLVIDKGHGVSPENLKKIFEPFFTTKEVGTGTGLGLSVSYGIIRDHDGEILVSSELGGGTTFTVVLPVQKSAASTDTGNRTKQSNHRQEES
ncbi:MAG: HAMP domain-containing protein [Candidatus Zixiibacteriota bacterium]|nr:MAG: HAMP domain-containing protein [candidate division Zixibacteria bacterium]